MSLLTRTVLPVLLLGSLLTGCATHSDGTAPLNQRTWPICSLIGGLVGGGLGAIESGGWAAGGAALGILTGGLICYAQDGDEDGDGVFDRRDRCPDTPANTPVEHHGCPLPQYPASVKPAEPAQSEVITLSDAGDVLFAFNQSDLTPAAQESTGFDHGQTAKTPMWSASRWSAIPTASDRMPITRHSRSDAPAVSPNTC